jgi:hypothetical protein
MRASAVPDDCVITLSEANVSKTFKQFNMAAASTEKDEEQGALPPLIWSRNMITVQSLNLQPWTWP